MAGGRGIVKLFGKAIPVAPAEAGAPAAVVEEGGGGGTARGRGEGGDKTGGKGPQNHTMAAEPQQRDQESPSSEERTEKATHSAGSERHKQGSGSDRETEPAKISSPREQANNAGDLAEKPVKKPDKILPCPRCSSMDTKFCYYNNYNVNQPRHFCKNCQRYWTAGGTMRNVPVGAGRRKNKHSANHYRHITVSDDTLQMVRPDFNRQVHNPVLKPNGTVLSFGSGMPLCETVASVLNLAEKTLPDCNRNGFHHPEEHMTTPSSRGVGATENVEEQSSGSSGTSSNLTEDGCGADLQEPARPGCQGFLPQVPCLNGTPCSSPWNVSSPYCVPSFPIPFYPPTGFWSCAIPGTWGVPLMAPLPTSPPNGGLSGSNQSTPTLGKHSREGNVLTQSNKRGNASALTPEERCLWIPKTLRIDNPEEAAKSSIWATIGIKNGKAGISKGELFKPFDRPKTEIKSLAAETSKVLHANPAALSRAAQFQECL